jgi:hypothetical protein
LNAIALHKDELEKLLVNLSHDTAVSGTGFVALVDAYITRLDANCPDISARVNPPPAEITRRTNMEPTLTQTVCFTTRNIKLQNAAPRFSKDFALRPASKCRILTGD